MTRHWCVSSATAPLAGPHCRPRRSMQPRPSAIRQRRADPASTPAPAKLSVPIWLGCMRPRRRLRAPRLCQLSRDLRRMCQRRRWQGLLRCCRRCRHRVPRRPMRRPESARPSLRAEADTPQRRANLDTSSIRAATASQRRRRRQFRREESPSMSLRERHHLLPLTSRMHSRAVFKGITQACYAVTRS